MPTVVLLAENVPDIASLRATLESLRYRIVDELRSASALLDSVTRLAPNVVIVRAHSPTGETLEALRELSESNPRPVVVFANDPNRELIRKAVDAGAAAYVVEGWATERMTSIIDAACARFDLYESLKKELAATRIKLAERKVIEKAKGIVMHQRGLTEDQAYGALRAMAMDQNLALAEVARRVIAVAQLLA